MGDGSRRALLVVDAEDDARGGSSAFVSSESRPFAVELIGSECRDFLPFAAAPPPSFLSGESSSPNVCFSGLGPPALELSRLHRLLPFLLRLAGVLGVEAYGRGRGGLRPSRSSRTPYKRRMWDDPRKGEGAEEVDGEAEEEVGILAEVVSRARMNASPSAPT